LEGSAEEKISGRENKFAGFSGGGSNHKYWTRGRKRGSLKENPLSQPKYGGAYKHGTPGHILAHSPGVQRGHTKKEIKNPPGGKKKKTTAAQTKDFPGKEKGNMGKTQNGARAILGNTPWRKKVGLKYICLRRAHIFSPPENTSPI